VVTNVLPYIIALSALVIMMKAAGVTGPRYTLNVAVTLVAMLYSTYALYASGHEAVMGGMLVTALAFIVWGFLAPRFVGKQSTVPASSPVAAPVPSGAATA